MIAIIPTYRLSSPLISGPFRRLLSAAMKAVGSFVAAVRPAEPVQKEMMFAEVMNKYQPIIRRICFSYASSKEDFEDLRQDILINIWKGLNGYRADASFSTWVYRVALNTCVSTLRTRNRRPDTIGIEQFIGDIPDSDSGNEMKENIRVLYDAISRLTPVEKAIITMHLDECSYEEISEVIGISQGNVGVRLSRIRKKMASYIRNAI